jgi:hypothetical protein
MFNPLFDWHITLFGVITIAQISSKFYIYVILDLMDILHYSELLQ